MGQKLKLAGAARAQMVQYVRQPLRAWIKAHMKSSFPDPTASEAHDITAEGVMLAFKDTIGPEALRAMAHDILEGKHK